MEYYRPMFRSPRMMRSESYAHRSSSVSSTSFPHLSSRRSSFVSTAPRSRSSFGYTMSDVSRDNCLVTRHMTTTPLYTPSFSGFSSYSVSPLRSSLFSRGRSFSIEPTTSVFPLSWERSSSPIRSRTSYSSYVSTSPRLARRDSFDKPYYTINSSGSLGSELVVKRTSVSQHQSPVKTTVVMTTPVINMSAASASEGKFLAESNVVTKRTSVQKETTNVVSPVTEKRTSFSVVSPVTEKITSVNVVSPVTEKRTSVSVVSPVTEKRTSVSVVSPVTEKRTSSNFFDNSSLTNSSHIFRRSSIDPSLNPNRIERGFYCHGSASSMSYPFYQSGTYFSMPPAPVSKISVVDKSTTENGPKISVKEVELENMPSMKTKSFSSEIKTETETFPERSVMFEDLRKRTMEAKNCLGRHRILLDRYLPVNLGPEPDVAFEIQNKYGELVDRMPHIERRSEVHVDEKKQSNEEVVIKIKPYQPAKFTKSYTSSIYRVNVPNSFTPVLSDTRRRAREVLCRVKGDPFYFNYS